MRKRFHGCASGEHGRQRGQCCKQRLAVEEWRDQQEYREAHEQRSVAQRAHFEELDADQHEQERDAGIAADEVAVRLADRERDGEREHGERPRRYARRVRGRTGAIAAQQHEAQHDECDAEQRDPDRQMHGLWQLRRYEQHAEAADLRRRQQR